ncbi:MAG: DUF6455 family protein [Albidovulum sp.]
MAARIPARRIQTKLDAYIHLTSAMAYRHGVDLAQALHQGLLDRGDLSVMLRACRDCPGGPDDHLAEAGCDDAIHQAPAWCANGPILEGLRGLL